MASRSSVEALQLSGENLGSGNETMKRWYVVQVYAGYEELARKDIVKRIEESGLKEQFGQVLVPEAKITKSLFEPEAEGQQLFPGYVLVEMESSPETIQAVTRCTRVLHFLGGKEPSPLSKGEVDRILSQVRGEVIVTAKTQDRFLVGSEVEILEGPFSGFVGMVDRVDSESEKLAVMVSIFGRMTPVELRFHQVKQ